MTTISMINVVDFGSTGKIMLQLKRIAESDHFIVNTFSKRRFFRQRGKNFFGYVVENLIHRIISPLIGCESLLSFFGTLSLCRSLLKNKTQLIHLHNIHGYFFCFPLFFRFVKKHNIPIIWTLHDCWSFTGRCPHFAIQKCEKWKKGCCDCPFPSGNYPKSYIDTSRAMWKLKRRFFTGIENMTIVTPSQWLAEMVKDSFLNGYPVKVINNGIDLSVFKPVESDFRIRYSLTNKKIVLGVAFGWGLRKGLDVFIELAKSLPDNYRIVLVGTNDVIESKLPQNIISIHRTHNQHELAQIYTAADVYVNPTREDTFPTVNMEALACGTPVVTFKTGGSPEILDNTCGSVVPYGDVIAMEKEIRVICDERPFSCEKCIARAQLFDRNKKFEEYVCLYRNLTK